MIIRDTLNKHMDPKLVICACHNDEHQIIFYPDEEEQIIYMHTHLTDWTPWYKRLWHGIRYIFGYTSRYGEWDELILTHRHAKHLRDMADFLDSKS